MGRVPWSEEEDDLLKKCIERYGEGKWHRVPLLAGLNRCRKSCRLRWLNYLRPSVKRGSFANDEVDLIIKLHKLLGNRWSLIAARLPGRTANDVKNFWNCHLRRKLSAQGCSKDETSTTVQKLIYSPLPSLESTATRVRDIKPQARNVAAAAAATSFRQPSRVINHPEPPPAAPQPTEVEENNPYEKGTTTDQEPLESTVGEVLEIDFEFEEFGASGGGCDGDGGADGGVECSKWEWEDWSMGIDLWDESF